MKAFVITSAIAAVLRSEGVAAHIDPQHIERDEPEIDRVFVQQPVWRRSPTFKVKRITTPTGFFWVVKGDPSRRQFRLKADADAHLATVEKAR